VIDFRSTDSDRRRGEAGGLARSGANTPTDGRARVCANSAMKALLTHSCGDKSETLQSLAAELVRRKSDVIVGEAVQAVRALQRTTKTTPVVFITGDPVTGRFVQSLAHPGGIYLRRQSVARVVSQAGRTGSEIGRCRGPESLQPACQDCLPTPQERT